MGGFRSLEEHMQEYLEIFLRLQQEQVPGFFEERRKLLEERERQTDIFLPAVCLQERCLLTPVEYWIMMFAFCCEVESGLCIDYRNRYQENWPSLQYILHLLSAVMPVSFSDVAQLCGSGGALRSFFILEGEAEEREQRGFLHHPLFLNPTVLHFLLTGGLTQEDWYTLHMAEEEEDVEKEKEQELFHEKEYALLREYLGAEEPVRVLLYGSKGSGSHGLVRRACGEMHLNSMFLSTKSLLRISKSRWSSLRQTLHLICALLDPVIILEPADDISGVSKEQWEDMYYQLFRDLGNVPLCILAQTRAQADLAKEYADVFVSLQEEIFWEEKRESFRFGKLVADRFDPEEIILPPDCRRQLDTVIRLARAWQGKKGLQILFHGSSGTGKTMAASLLAGQLQLPLLKVDLSRVFDKYIGETEKHIDEIFDIAYRGHYLLFFDEADALFAKRTALRDSHDRYANVSAAFLLQRMEEYEGILILATNLRDHFDDAFVRRIRFAVKFRNLDREDRERLWRKVLEGDPPIARDVDFGALAEAAELSPARISAAAYVAKLLAEGDGSKAVTKNHLREALTLEASKDETALKEF